jgi:spore germination cell wall hydrolase CwlJ-like protein
VRLSGGDDSQRAFAWGLRIAALPLIAMFANLSLPTQAALPEFSIDDWTAPISRDADLQVNQDNKSGRWWAVSRAAHGPDADLAIRRGFETVAPARLAGHLPMEAGPVADAAADALAIAYTPFEAKKLVWSPLAFYAEPPVRKGDPAWMRKPLAADTFSAKQQTCLATALYFEARGESAKGQAAVAQVILNRVRNPAYPNTICGVVYQNAAQRNRCQFSFACDGAPDTIARLRPWERAKKIAAEVTNGQMAVPEVGSATHYFASYVQPRWANSMVKMASIGTHEFFRTHGGGWK